MAWFTLSQGDLAYRVLVASIFLPDHTLGADIYETPTGFRAVIRPEMAAGQYVFADAQTFIEVEKFVHEWAETV